MSNHFESELNFIKKAQDEIENIREKYKKLYGCTMAISHITKPIEYSDWECHYHGYQIGMPSQLMVVPIKGREPNWFHRLMQRLILGHIWIKREKQDERPL